MKSRGGFSLRIKTRGIAKLKFLVNRCGQLKLGVDVNVILEMPALSPY